MKAEVKTCQNCKQEFLIEPDDFSFYEKIKVPPPTWCPECRMIRRFAHRNERNLFRATDVLTGKEIFSGIPPHALVKIYDHDYWWSDNWDPLDYGREYDFSRPFFKQFKELMQVAPFPSRNVTNLINSDYSDQSGDLKNCYLCFNCGRIENSAYIVNANFVNDSYDLTDAANVELSYDSLSVDGGYKMFFSMYCSQSDNLRFCLDCIGCSECFGCVNLRNKKYHIFNKPYTKEDYFKQIEKFQLDSYTAINYIRAEAEKVWSVFPRKYMHGVKNLNVSGDYINASKNVHSSFGIGAGENLKYCQELYQQKGRWEGAKDSYDYYNWGYGSELMYEVCGSGQGCRGLKCCLDCYPADQDLEYCMRCASSHNLFGCVGLKKKSYCILNKQYAKEEYVVLYQKIINHMNEMPYVSQVRSSQFGVRNIIYKYGEFFPAEFSLFAYNETVAHDYFPLTKEQAESKGYQWKEVERREYKSTIDANNLPDTIGQATDAILKEIISCSSCKKAYRIIASELEFLRKHSISLPRLCVNCRYARRFSYRNKPRFWHRQCACAGSTSSPQAGLSSENNIYKNTARHFHQDNPCPNKFETTYEPERPEIVYCEQCYQTEVS